MDKKLFETIFIEFHIFINNLPAPYNDDVIAKQKKTMNRVIFENTKSLRSPLEIKWIVSPRQTTVQQRIFFVIMTGE